MLRLFKGLAIGAAALAALAFLWLFFVSCGCFGSGTITGARFASLRANDPSGLRAFLQAMPKGADLHVHLSGAIYVEDFIAWAADRKLCYQLPEYKFIECKPDTGLRVSDALAPVPTAQRLYDDIVNAQSLRNYRASPAAPSGHDQFFATFDKYGDISWRVTGEMIATLLRRYAAENVQHTELMITLAPQEPKLDDELLGKVGAAADTPARLAVLKDYIEKALPNAKKNLDDWETAVKRELKCTTPQADPGCAVTYRYIAQVNRNSDENKVFANTAFAAALVRADPRVGGLNFVGPEDYRIARTDYRTHMKTIGALTAKDGGAKEVPVALHAGELWIGLVPPDDLSFHIGDAVRTAGAKRIGHGVALAFEKESGKLLTEMRTRKVAVEINLTSNDGILGVRGKDHPLMTYRAARVPVVISTDDAGVSRIDLTNEYFRAARDYPLSYGELRRIARDSIEYSFLDAAEKKKAFEAFDKESRRFEREVVAQSSLFANMRAVTASWFR